nr:M56 family metallopeptidase [uncultured Mucilaginibacter sp.]
MPTLFVFLFKVNMALLLFCAGYYLVLRHLTFYSLNRVYLITAIIFASIYPKIDLTAFAQRHENIAAPVQSVILNWQAPAAKLVKPLAQPDYWQWATVVFWAGAALLAFRLLMQLFSLLKLHRRSTSANVLNHEVRLISGEAAPFSFWRSIYVNPANHSAADLKAILLHEQVHVNGWHTIDILLAELSSIFYWFNPGVWLMKKAVRENIEFITDRKILNKGIDTKAYQYSLVNVSFNATTPGIVNHFNISTIKKRIIMMNAKRSSRVNLTRYAFIVPAVALLLVFSFSNAAVVKKNSAKAYKAISKTINEKLAGVMPLVNSVATSMKTTTYNKPGGDNAKYSISGNIKTDKLDATINSTINTTKENLQLLIDTNKISKVTFTTNNISLLDSLNYVLNGKKITIDEFNKIDPNKIIAVNIVTAETAKAMLNDYDSMGFKPHSKILFVTTSDSEKGRQLADRLTDTRVTAVRINGKNLKLTGDLNPRMADSMVIVRSYGNGKNDINRLRISSKNMDGLTPRELDSIIMLRGGDLEVASKLNGDLAPINNLKRMTYSYSSPADITKKLSDVKVYTRTSRSPDIAEVRALQGNIFYSEKNISRISDKLIIIDGKEATEKDLKKLSAFDIDRMSTSSDADTVKKYGAKAKYGVVYIYTKKAK